MTVALMGYIWFYWTCLDVKDKLIVASFNEVTSDMGTVVERVNSRYGTGFVPFDHTPANVERCFEVIAASVNQPAERFHMVLPSPSPVREQQRERLSEEYERCPGLLRRRAVALYRHLVPARGDS
jgi:hypothetical protein